jgi:hypothetical protein
MFIQSLVNILDHYIYVKFGRILHKFLDSTMPRKLLALIIMLIMYVQFQLISKCVDISVLIIMLLMHPLHLHHALARHVRRRFTFIMHEPDMSDVGRLELAVTPHFFQSAVVEISLRRWGGGQGCAEGKGKKKEEPRVKRRKEKGKKNKGKWKRKRKRKEEGKKKGKRKRRKNREK